jgi:hypothetical protein
VELRLDVHDISNSSTPLGTLSEVYGRQMLTDVRGRGLLTFQVDDASTDDLNLLAYRRVVRVHADQGDGWRQLESFIVDDMPQTLSDVPSRTVQCQGLLGWLGYDRGGALLLPRGGLGGRNPRLFGWQSFDYIEDSQWFGPPYDWGTQGAPDAPFRQGRPDPWPDPAAYRLYGTDMFEGSGAGAGTLNHPVGVTLYRQPIDIPAAGAYTLYVNGENWRVWLGGDDTAALSELGAGASSVTRTVELPAGPLMFAATAANFGGADGPANNVSWLMWTLVTFEEDPEVAPTVIARSEPSSVRVAYDPDPWPGVTAGLILDTAFSEAQARGMLPWITWTFDDALDSEGVPWVQLISHEFRVQLCGRLAEDVAGLLDCEVWATPSGEVRAVPYRGVDRTGSVTVSFPFGRRLSGEGPRITRAVFETPVGMGATSGVNEGTYGPMEDLLTLGTATDVQAVRLAATRFVQQRSKPFSVADVELPDDVRPYEDVFLGDRVTLAGVGPVRLSTFDLSDADTGRPEWAAFAEPV